MDDDGFVTLNNIPLKVGWGVYDGAGHAIIVEKHIFLRSCRKKCVWCFNWAEYSYNKNENC